MRRSLILWTVALLLTVGFVALAEEAHDRRLALAVPILAVGGGLFFFVVYLAWRSGAPRWARVTVSCLGALACVGIAVSRVYPGVHWASDVFGGFLGGGAYVFAVVAWLEHRPEREEGFPSARR